MSALTLRTGQNPVITACEANQAFLTRTPPENRNISPILVTDLVSENKNHFYASRQQYVTRIIYSIALLAIATVAITLTALLSPINIPLAAVGIAILSSYYVEWVYEPFGNQGYAHTRLALEAKYFMGLLGNNVTQTIMEKSHSELKATLSSFYQRMGLTEQEIPKHTTQLEEAFSQIHQATETSTTQANPSLALTLSVFSSRETRLLGYLSEKSIEAATVLQTTVESDPRQEQNTFFQTEQSTTSIALENSTKSKYNLFEKKIKLAQHALALIDPSKESTASQYLPLNVNWNGQITLHGNILTNHEFETLYAEYLGIEPQSEKQKMMKAFFELPIMMPMIDDQEIRPLGDGEKARCFMEAVMLTIREKNRGAQQAEAV